MWDKPKKAQSTEEWKNGYSFEDGPAGGYQNNMSDEDANRWRAKITGTKLGFPQVEIRKTAGAQITIIVNLGQGYNYKGYRAVEPRYEGWTIETWREQHPSYHSQYSDEQIENYLYPTRGINVHMSMNGPAQLTFTEMTEMHLAIEEAKVALMELGAQ